MEQSGIDLQQSLPGLPGGLVEPTQVVGTGTYLVWGGAAILLATVLLLLAAVWMKRYRAREKDRGGLPPKREAEAALRDLESRTTELTASELATALSAVLRRCVDRTWKTELSHQTWHEHWTEGGPGLAQVPGEESQTLASLLADCNALQFEPVEISLPEKERLLQRALDWTASLPVRATPAGSRRQVTPT